MKIKEEQVLLLVLVLSIVLLVESECKRGGRRGGVYRSSSNVWGRSKQSHGGGYDTHRRKQKSEPTEFKKLETAPKQPSAPPAPKDASKSMIDHEKKQGVATNQRPIGWDVGQTGSKSGSVGRTDTMNKQTSSVNQAGNPSGASYGQTHGQAPPSYNAQGQPHQPYGQAPPPYSPYGHAPPPHNYGQAPPPYSHGAPPPNYHPGGYQGMGGYGHPSYGGFGANPHYGMGMGMGGFGGMGGYTKPSSGFGSGFIRNAVVNMAAGALIWHMVSGLTRRPYEVHNYYNRPNDVPAEMELPANIITLCPEKVSELCAPNTLPLCTANNTIMCAVDADKTTPCQGNITGPCITSVTPCDDSSCGSKNKEESNTITIPCIANATVSGKVEMNIAPGVLDNKEGGTVLCITTVAMPQPEGTDTCNPEGGNVNGTSPCIPLNQPPPIVEDLNVTTKEPILNAKIIIPPPTNSTIVKE